MEASSWWKPLLNTQPQSRSGIPAQQTTRLTHWGWVTHICVSKLTIIGSDNGFAPGRRQAIIWTNAGILLNGSLRTNSTEILIKIHTFSFKKMHLNMSSAKCQQFCLSLKVLKLAIIWQTRALIAAPVGMRKFSCWGYNKLGLSPGDNCLNYYPGTSSGQPIWTLGTWRFHPDEI